MSHFLCLVILPEGTVIDNVEPVVSELMEPYAEFKLCDEEYCICSGKENEIPFSKEDWLLGQIFEKVTKEKPNPNCPSCGGTGRITFNRNAKWDGWEIGGRWNGRILGPAPMDTSLKNVMGADVCLSHPDSERQTALREMWKRVADKNPLTQNAPLKPAEVKPHKSIMELERRYEQVFNSTPADTSASKVAGTDTSQNHPGPEGPMTSSREEDLVIRNACSVTDISSVLAYRFAIVTPEGRWHEPHEMDSWLFWFDETYKFESPEWRRQVEALFTQYANNIAVAIDCHI